MDNYEFMSKIAEGGHPEEKTRFSITVRVHHISLFCNHMHVVYMYIHRGVWLCVAMFGERLWPKRCYQETQGRVCCRNGCKMFSSNIPCEEGARLFTFANAPQDYEFAIREVKLLQYLSHENIVQLLEVSCVVPNLL